MDTLFRNSLVSLYLIALPTVAALFFLQAPYGKHRRAGWGPSIPTPAAWIVMESPTLFVTFFLFPSGRHVTDPRCLALIAPYLVHYLHRTIIHPLRLRSAPSPSGFPALVAAFGFGFNLLNAYVQTRFVSHYNDYDSDRLFWTRFGPGLALFGLGMWINVRSDQALVRLKREARGGYKIPRGGWFEFVSCPNYFGEIVEWFGWAVMSCSWAALGFFLYTCANLVPRARANHEWYFDKFGEDYPKARKAVIPFLY